MSGPCHVLVFPSDATGCGMYRMIWPGQAVYNSGKPVNVMNRAPKIEVHGGVITGINIGTATAVVFQRPASYQMPQVIPLLQEQGVKVIIDMDDSLSTIHPKNSAHKSYDPRMSHQRNHMHAARSCELADLVTVTTEALAEEYGSHGRVSIIPNHVPASYLEIRRPENKTPIIGWAGFTQTHADDLTVTSGVINSVLNDTGAIFAAFGDERIFVEMCIPAKGPNQLWSFENIHDYPKKLVGFDIGLVPLELSTFNSGKSWLKCLEYASLGVVPVASPTPDNLKFSELGGCIIAEKSDDWYREVKELVLDHDKRAEISKKVREVAAAWTFEGNSNKWWEAWSSDSVLTAPTGNSVPVI